MGSTIVASKTALEKAIRLAWLDDLNTFGEDSYVYNNDEKLKALFGMKEAINSGMAGQRVFAYGAEKGLHVGNALALINGIGSANWAGLNTVEAVLGSSVAMSAVNANIRAKNAFYRVIGYMPLEYIESTGTQYIKTGWMFGSTNYTASKIRFESELGLSDGSSWIVTGCGAGTSFYVGLNQNNKIYYGNGGADTDTGVTYNGNKCIFELDMKNKTLKVTDSVDGTVYVNASNITPSTPTRTAQEFFLFAYSNATDQAMPHSEKLYMYQIYENDVLVRDFVPAKDLNGVICLYDKVTKQFFYNAGSGDFITESALDGTENPEESVVSYTEVEYLQSGYNSAFFNTGYNPNSNTRVVMDVEIYSDTTDVGGYYFGMYTGDNNDYSVYFDPSERGYISHYFGGNTDVYKEYYDYLYGYRFTIDKTTTKTSITNTAGDEYVVGTYTTASGNVSGIPMFIMAANSSNGAVEPKNMKFYSMQIYEGSTLVHDYVAAKDSDNTPCIYDKVTETALYNACTTDQFNKGDSVLIVGPEIA